MTFIQTKLFEVQDTQYAAFQAKLTPGIAEESFIGVRVPQCRNLAKNLLKTNPTECMSFINELPHKYYDENMLHGLIVSELKEYENCIEKVEKFLPYVDNWAVCDIMSPVIFKKHKEALLEKIKIWIKTDRTYTIRFGLEMLMKYFLDKDFKNEYLELASSVKSTEYYVNMMLAWYFATALAKQWDSAIIYLEKPYLDKWTHNKTIQKAIESYRISDEQKKYLRTLKK